MTPLGHGAKLLVLMRVSGTHVVRSTAISGIAAFLVAASLSAQQTRLGGVIDGVVSDTILAPLDRVTASLLGTEVRVTTSTTGRFRITGIPAGSHILELRRLGYGSLVSSVTVGEGDTLRLSFVLQPLATTLAPTVVTGERVSAKMREFDARRRAGFGRFLTEDDISAKKASFAADLLRSIPQVQVRTTGSGQTAMSLRNGPAACAYEVFLDGLPMPMPTNLDDLPRPADLAGIEVYSGPATVPLQYKRAGGRASCGVILVWTKDGS